MDDNVLGFPHGHIGTSSGPVDPPSEVNPNECEVDLVNSPPHYTKNGVEAVDIIEHIIHDYPSVVAYHIASTLKYLCRAPYKGSMEQDLKKGRWHLARAIRKL